MTKPKSRVLPVPSDGQVAAAEKFFSRPVRGWPDSVRRYGRALVAALRMERQRSSGFAQLAQRMSVEAGNERAKLTEAMAKGEVRVKELRERLDEAERLDRKWTDGGHEFPGWMTAPSSDPDHPNVCRWCRTGLVRFPNGDTCPSRSYPGQVAYLYDRTCPRYSKWNPFTWMHTGRVRG